jgi:hypothetical protein
VAERRRDRQRNINIELYRSGQTKGDRDREIDRETDRQTDRKTYTEVIRTRRVSNRTNRNVKCERKI